MDTKKPPAIQTLSVDETATGQRLDNFLIKHLKGLPKSRLYRSLRSGEIRVNKKRAKPDYRLEPHDLIRIPPLRLAVPTAPSQPPMHLLKQIEDSILFEDKKLIIINKPSGIASHGGSGINFGVIELLRHLRPQLKFLELVHRLDRETTGCLMLAKKPSILKELHALLIAGKVKKNYLALVKNSWQGEATRQIKQPLLKNVLNSGERIVKVNPAGKPSETRFTLLKSFTHVSLLSARPITGRTHQIRVHASYMGHPIIGDEKYGDKHINKKASQTGIKHLLLHSASLSFYLASTKETIAVCATLDSTFSKALALLKNAPNSLS